MDNPSRSAGGFSATDPILFGVRGFFRFWEDKQRQTAPKSGLSFLLTTTYRIRRHFVLSGYILRLHRQRIIRIKKIKKPPPSNIPSKPPMLTPPHAYVLGGIYGKFPVVEYVPDFREFMFFYNILLGINQII
jgi:hypothetical protein